MSKDATGNNANEQAAPQDNAKLLEEMEKALNERAQFLIANDPQCCQLRGALDYASGKYQLKADDEPTDGASE
jgi:hypothetical protein